MKKITAYRTSKDGEIKKGDPSRKWMDFTSKRFAYGCLPLVIANELGWDILLQTSFKAIWNGEVTPSSISIEFVDKNNPLNEQVASHFGHGVLTFHPNFLFQTQKDVNLIVKGVPNLLKDGIQPLEGLVETDWLPLTFTMNWKFTRPNTWVEFSFGEPIARIVPYPRNFIETFDPTIELMQKDSDLHKKFNIWSKDRFDFIEENKSYIGDKNRMEKNYFQGIDKEGKKIDFHQRKVALKDFKEHSTDEY